MLAPGSISRLQVSHMPCVPLGASVGLTISVRDTRLEQAGGRVRHSGSGGHPRESGRSAPRRAGAHDHRSRASTCSQPRQQSQNGAVRPAHQSQLLPGGGVLPEEEAHGHHVGRRQKTNRLIDGDFDIVLGARHSIGRHGSGPPSPAERPVSTGHARRVGGDDRGANANHDEEEDGGMPEHDSRGQAPESCVRPHSCWPARHTQAVSLSCQTSEHAEALSPLDLLNHNQDKGQEDNDLRLMCLPCDKVELTDSSTWASIADDLPLEFISACEEAGLPPTIH